MKRQLDSNYNKNLDRPAGVDSIYPHRGGSPRQLYPVASGATPGRIAEKSESLRREAGERKSVPGDFESKYSSDLIAVQLLYIAPMLLNTILKCLTFYLSRTFHVFG